MQKQKSLIVNFITNTVLTISSFIFPLITFPYISRILLPEGIGKVSFAASVVSYFAMFAQLGIPVYGIRACAIVRDDREELSRTVHELFFINLWMSLFSYGILFIGIISVPRLRQEKELFLIISLTIVFNMLGMEWLYKALEKYAYIAGRSIICKLLALGGMFLLVHGPDDYICYGALTIFAASASNIFNLLHVHKYIAVSFLGAYKLKRHFKAVAVFFAMSCATTIYTNLDTVMLGFMESDTEVGYYNAAVKIKLILVSIVTSLGTVLLPRVSYYAENGFWDEFRRIASKAINFVFIVAMPLCVYFMLFAGESIYFLSGDAYGGSVAPMQIIMPTLLLIGLTNVMGIQMLVPVGKEKYVLYSEVAGASVDFMLNVLLIPRFAAAGAALGTLAAEAVVFGGQLCFLRKEVKELYSHIRYEALLTASLIGVPACVWVKLCDWNAFMTLAVSAVIYFGMYAVLLCIMREPLTVEMKDKILGKLISRK